MADDQAARVRKHAYIAAIQRFMEGYDFLLTPAVSVPSGFTADGLPVGLQIVGRRHDELGVLQAAAAFEAVAPWAQHRPKLG